MKNRLSSAGYICAPVFLSAVAGAWFFLFFLFSCFALGPYTFPPTEPKRGLGLFSVCPPGCAEGAWFIFFFLLLFFLFSPIPPPLGKSSASSKSGLAAGSGFLEVGTGLLGFHGLTLPTLSCCLYLLNFFVLGVAALKSLSLKNKWLGLGLWLLGVCWGVWLDW